MLIFWVRSKSLQDFVGHYRVWAWTAAVWLMFGGVVATDAHVAFSESVFWFWNGEFWRKETLCWLIPAAIGGCFVLRCLNQDMCDCRSSLTLLWLAAASYLLSSLLKLEIIVLLPQPWYDLASMGTFMFGSLFLFLSMLLHARYVIYESCEAPNARPSRLQTFLRRTVLSKFCVLLPNRRHRQISTKAVTDVSYDTQPQIENSGVADAEDEEPESPAGGVEADPSPDALGRESSQGTISASDERKEVDIDQQHVKPNLKGLSKKQRRRSRKQWREEQRSTAQ